MKPDNDNNTKNITERFNQLENKIEKILSVISENKTNNLKENINKFEETTQNNCLIDFKAQKENQLQNFIQNISDECAGKEICRTMFERSINKILTCLMEKGSEQALYKISFHREKALEKYERNIVEKMHCCEQSCFNNIINSYNTVEKLIENSLSPRLINENREIICSYSNRPNYISGDTGLRSNKYYIDSNNPEDWIQIDNEENISQLMNLLSNPNRIRILNYLAFHPLQFKDLERQTGIKTNLQFHLNKLVNAGLVIKDSIYNTNKFRYILHIKTAKILRLIYLIKEIY